MSIRVDNILDNVKRSLIQLHLTVLLLGGTALFSQIPNVSAMDITFVRSLFAFVALLLTLKLFGNDLKLATKKDWLLTLVLGLLMAAHWVTYFYSMKVAGVSIGLIALFTFPIITVLIEPLFDKARLKLADLMASILVLVGIFLMTPDINLQNEVTLGIAVGVLSAVLYAFRNVIHRKYFSHHSGIKAMTLQTLVVCITLIFFVDDLAGISHESWLLLLLLGTVFTALPHALIASILIHLKAKTFSLVACMQPLYGVVLAILLLGENPNWQTLVGGCLIVSAAVYETYMTSFGRGVDK